MKLYHRHGFGQFLHQLNLNGVGVEVGSGFGGFAERILEQWPGTLYMIDPWTRQPDHVYREATNRQVNLDKWYEQAVAAVSRFENRARILRTFSDLAAPQFEDESLDFVYIDGNHSFEAVTLDLALWFPKVRRGGIFSGHDYYDSEERGNYCYVKSALDTWSRDNNQTVLTTEGGCTSWYMVK